MVYLIWIEPLSRTRAQKVIRKRRDQFVALASHYLITPISIIQTAVCRLQENEGKLSLEERQRLYETIRSGQQRLWVLTERFLISGNISDGNLTLKPEVVNLYEMISEAMEMVDPFAREKKIKIAFPHKKEYGDTRLDARLIKQAIIAVLENAIKFSPEGSEVTVGLEFESGIFTMRVEDRGIGMAPEVLNHLTEGFYRGSEVYNFDYEGIGLGLFIAQAIVTAHQGVLTFNSQLNQGTEVKIQLPNY